MKSNKFIIYYKALYLSCLYVVFLLLLFLVFLIFKEWKRNYDELWTIYYKIIIMQSQII